MLCLDIQYPSEDSTWCFCIFFSILADGKTTITPNLLWTMGVFWLVLSCGSFLALGHFLLNVNKSVASQSLKQTPLQISRVLSLYSSFLCGTVLQKFYLFWFTWIMTSALQLREITWLCVVALKLPPGSKLVHVEVPWTIFFLSEVTIL